MPWCCAFCCGSPPARNSIDGRSSDGDSPLKRAVHLKQVVGVMKKKLFRDVSLDRSRKGLQVRGDLVSSFLPRESSLFRV